MATDVASSPPPPRQGDGDASPTPRRLRRRTRAAVVVGIVLSLDVAIAAAVWPRHHTRQPAPSPSATADPGWGRLDPAARCASALALVAAPNPWPMLCRWREPAETASGTAFPPPIGEPPWDHPHIEVYLRPSEGRASVAHTIAHELGHMRHTRVATVGPAWLAARGLPADTPWTVWVEDYAEAFAAVFGPPGDQWDASTTRPTPTALASLKTQFFAG